MKKFIFLYPIKQYFDFEIESHCNREELENFREKYKETINKCINERYRKNGWKIYFATFNDCKISDVIEKHPEDVTINVNLNYATHVREKIYPNEKLILDQIGKFDELRISGFHLGDCVERLAKHAYARSKNILVDEDLSEMLPFFMRKEDFNSGSYPSA
jgi:hypothetical protein